MAIVTLQFESSAQERLTAWRQRYFPAERNFLSAHVTLFHNLPEVHRPDWEADLRDLCAGTSGFEVKVGDPYSLGGGFAVAVESAALRTLRQALADRWFHFLTPQDRQKYRPHCTLQNKVTGEIARRDLQEFKTTWVSFSTKATGLQTWHYENGPWRFDRAYLFK